MQLTYAYVAFATLRRPRKHAESGGGGGENVPAIFRRLSAREHTHARAGAAAAHEHPLPKKATVSMRFLPLWLLRLSGAWHPDPDGGLAPCREAFLSFLHKCNPLASVCGNLGLIPNECANT